LAQLPDTLQNASLTDEQVLNIVEFLKTLTDPCVKDRACLAAWIPGVGDSNPDILRVNAIDNFGQFLYKNRRQDGSHSAAPFFDR
jgi:cytochrome c peroxidase